MAAIHLTEEFKIADATFGPVTTNGGITTDVVSSKTANGNIWFVLQITNAVGFAEVISCKQATNVAAGTNKAGPTCNIWANEASSTTSDTLTKQTSAASYTTNASISKKIVIFQIDVASLDLANSYDCVYFTISDSSQATNFASAVFMLETAFKQATPPTIITD